MRGRWTHGPGGAVGREGGDREAESAGVGRLAGGDKVSAARAEVDAMVVECGFYAGGILGKEGAEVVRVETVLAGWQHRSVGRA